MTFSELFTLFYTKYRGEENPPGITDPEWPIAVSNYNSALLRMAAFDDTKWNHMFTTLQDSTQVTPALVRTLSTGLSTYTAPTNMAEPAGMITYIDGSLNRHNYSLLQPHERQATSASSSFGYFTGDSQAGYVLHLNYAPTSTQNGYGLDYSYYRKPTLLNAQTETGSSVIEGGDPTFYFMHMVAQRFLDSRNFPAYQVALRDSEEALKGMKLKNNSGTWFSAWGVQDTGPGWGV